MDDGYIVPKRREFNWECPLCSQEIVLDPRNSSDPLMQRFKCLNPKCEADEVDPSVEIYGCTECGEDTVLFSDVNELPYCSKHMEK